MKLFVLLVLLLAACEKTSDVGAIQDEANGVVVTYKARFEALETRLKLLDDLRRTSPAAKAAPDYAQLTTTLANAAQRLKQMQEMVQRAPSTIANKAKPDAPRADLIGTMENYKKQFSAGQREINRNLDIAETWLAFADLRPKPVQQPIPEPPVLPTPEMPDPGAGSGSAAGTGSGAPVQ
jgi:hypothetical protein